MFSHSQLRNILPMVGLVCGTMICSGAIAGAPELETVAYTGLENSPPNFPGLFWNNAQQTSNLLLDDSGQGTFSATIFGDGIFPSNNKVQWYGSPSGWTNVLRNGDPAPGIPGVNLLVVQPFSIAANGTMAVSSSLKDGGVVTSTDTAFWIGTPGNLTLVAREGTTLAPGGATMTNTMSLSTVWMNNAGNILFSSNLSGGDVVGTTNNNGVYLGSSSGIVEVTRKGNPIPGAPALPATDGPFMTPDANTFRLNGPSEVVGLGTLVVGTAGGVTVNDDSVVWTTVGGPMRLVAREGDPVPGLVDVKYKVGSSFALATMGLTNSGKIVFQATLDNIAPGTSVTAANDTAWLMDDHGTVSVLVREDDPIDGELFNFAQVGGGLMVTDNLVAIAGASKAVTNNARLWTGPIGGPYTKIAQQAVTEVPGAPGVFLTVSPSNTAIALNGVGQLVFFSNLTGAVTIGLDDRAIFGWDSVGGLQMIARIGVTSLPELLEVSSVALVGTSGATGDSGSNNLTDTGWLSIKMTDVKGFTALVRTKPFEVDLPCDADIAPPPSGNGLVNVEDLLAVIGAWGACANPKDCPADIAPVGGDDVVNVSDLLAVVGAWGACP